MEKSDFLLKVQDELENAYLQAGVMADEATDADSIQKAWECAIFLNGELEMLDAIVEWLGTEEAAQWRTIWNVNAEQLRAELTHAEIVIRDSDEE